MNLLLLLRATRPQDGSEPSSRRTQTSHLSGYPPTLWKSNERVVVLVDWLYVNAVFIVYVVSFAALFSGRLLTWAFLWFQFKQVAMRSPAIETAGTNGVVSPSNWPDSRSNTNRVLFNSISRMRSTSRWRISLS